MLWFKSFHIEVNLYYDNVYTSSNSVILIPPHGEIAGFGASPKAIVQLGNKKHYELVEVTACNLIFIVEEEYDKLGITDNSLETLRNERNYCRLLPIILYCLSATWTKTGKLIRCIIRGKGVPYGRTETLFGRGKGFNRA